MYFQSFSISFHTNGLRWWCTSIEISGKYNASYECKNKIDTPVDKSFACEVSLNVTGVNDGNKSCLVFEGLQVRFSASVR